MTQPFAIPFPLTPPQDQHDTQFSPVNQSPGNGSSAASPEVTLRVEGVRVNGGNNSKNGSPSPSTLDDDLQMFDLENASSSSPISQIEMETEDRDSNKSANDSALLAFTCPAVSAVPSTPNVAVMGALSIVSSL